MKKIRLIISIGAAFLSLAASAQTDVDALRYSMINFGGTARYTAMVVAFGAVGGDFSVLSTNPAGIGVYRKSEFTFTPSICKGSTISTYANNKIEDFKYNFNFSNFGFVLVKNTDRGSDYEGWKFFNFGFGLNRYNNFHNRVEIEGNNYQSSLMDVYANAAQGSQVDELDNFNTRLAFNTYLIDTLSPTNYFSNVPSGGILQHKSIETRGGMQEMVLSVGANYNNKLFIGGTLGFPYLRYFEQSVYRESDNGDTLAGFDSFKINEDLSTTGSGVNFKFGLMYVAVDEDMLKVKLGAAVHTPTFFALHDEYSTKVESVFDGGSNYSDESPKGVFDYQLTTPMRAIGSLAVQIGQYGVISADYEFVDYSEARLRSRTEKYFDVNEAIQTKYTAANNLRFGAEAALGKYSLRGGYAIYGSPYKEAINDGKRTVVSGGIGIIEKNYFIDLSCVRTKSSENYYLYNITGMKPADLNKTSYNFLLLRCSGRNLLMLNGQEADIQVRCQSARSQGQGGP